MESRTSQSKTKDILSIRALTKRYGRFTAVDSLSFDVKQGEVFGLLGPNGAGKSTLIKMLTCFHKPTSGDALVDGVSIRDQSAIRELVGWAPQEDAFYRNLTVLENLRYFGTLYGMRIDEIYARANQLLSLLQLRDKIDARAGSLSGGMRRRLNMGIAMMHRPKVLYLDEPTAGVDPLSRMSLWDVVEEVRKEGISVLLCTHYLDEAEKLCDRVAIVRSGKLVIVDTPNNLKKKYGHTLEDAFKNLLSKSEQKKEMDKIPKKE